MKQIKEIKNVDYIQHLKLERETPFCCMPLHTKVNFRFTISFIKNRVSGYEFNEVRNVLTSIFVVGDKVLRLICIYLEYVVKTVIWDSVIQHKNL